MSSFISPLKAAVVASCNSYYSASTPTLLASSIDRGLRLKVFAHCGTVFGMVANGRTVQKVSVKDIPVTVHDNDLLKAKTVLQVASLTWDGVAIRVRQSLKGGGCCQSTPATLSDESEPLLGAISSNHMEGREQVMKLFDKARDLEKQGNKQEAIKYHKASIRGFELLKEVPPFWEHTLLGKLYMEVGDCPNAVKCFEKHYQIERVFGKNNTMFALSRLGEAYTFNKEYTKAINCLKESWAMLGPTARPDIKITFLTRLANAYEASGDLDEAIKNHQLILKIRQEALGADHGDVSISFVSIGNLYYSHKDYPKARDYYNQSLEVAKKAFGPESVQVADRLLDIGMIFNEEKNYPDAIHYLTLALEMRKKVLGYNHDGIALAYQWLGAVYRCQGDFNKAIENHKKTLDIWNEKHQGKHSYVASALVSLGKDYFAQNDWAKAIEYHSQALEIFKGVGMEGHTDMVECLQQLGDAHQKLGHQDEAIAFHEHVLAISQPI